MNYDTNRQYNKNLLKMGRFYLKRKNIIYFNIYIIFSVKLYKTPGTHLLLPRKETRPFVLCEYINLFK